ncbi:MAG: phage major capsid protein [Phycisphaerales bacterium]
MAPTIVGVDEVTSLSRRIIVPYITDQAYPSNALFFRLNAANRKRYEGGTHFEVPLLHQMQTNGGAYDGEGEVIADIAAQDNVKNMAFEAKYYQVPITLYERTLDRMNTSLAIANEMRVRATDAKMKMADLVGTDVSQSLGSSGAGAVLKQVTGLAAIIDDGTNAANYGELVRASNTYLNAQVDSATTAMTLLALRTMVGNCTFGAHSTTLIRSRVEQYNRYWALVQANQRFNVGDAGSDTALGAAGFRNLLFDNIPWVVDSKVEDGTGAGGATNSQIEFLCETVMEIATIGSGEFSMTDWRYKIDQPSAMTAFLKWKGELICSAPQLQGKFTAIES